MMQLYQIRGLHCASSSAPSSWTGKNKLKCSTQKFGNCFHYSRPTVDPIFVSRDKKFLKVNNVLMPNKLNPRRTRRSQRTGGPRRPRWTLEKCIGKCHKRWISVASNVKTHGTNYLQDVSHSIVVLTSWLHCLIALRNFTTFKIKVHANQVKILSNRVVWPLLPPSYGVNLMVQQYNFAIQKSNNIPEIL